MFDHLAEDKKVKYLTSLKVNHKKNLENFKSDYALLISKELSYIKQFEKLVGGVSSLIAET